ncbi:MAG: YitT family protein [Paludibacteraceae bacterium]|nr:YitT family protein [Paludibacteraceae bacterium]
MFRNRAVFSVTSCIYMILGVISATIGLKAFLLSNNFLDGGAMGVSLLINILTDIDLSVLIIIINLPFIIIGYRQISWQFAIRSTISIILLSVLVHFVELPSITSDKLLIAIFGGVFLGAGIGFSIRGGSVIDGTEVLAIYVSRRGGITVGNFIAIFNVALFLIAAFLINVETAMYSMLTYVAASKSVDFIINGIEEYIGVTIVSPQNADIRHMITDQLHRGVTVYRAAGGYQSAHDENRKVLFCVVTRLEVTKLLSEIEKIDPTAFVVQHSIREIKGGVLKKHVISH